MLRVLVTLVGLWTTAVSAVSLSPNGLGQVLLYPYYTVRETPGTSAPFNTLLSIVNATNDTKALRLRFREALVGTTVFEANIYLGARDVWTAAVVPVGDGAGLLTVDGSCTQPQLRGAAGTVPDTAKFSNAKYADDPLSASLDRVREGFVEVLELGTIFGSSPLAMEMVLIAGRPASCKLGDDAAMTAAMGPPTGGLYGGITLVNVLGGTAYGYDAVALEEWSQRPMYTPPGTDSPTLADANPPASTVVGTERILTSTWSRGLDAVNAVLMADTTTAEYMREETVSGATDIVYALPTKPLAVTSASVVAPFTTSLNTNGACELARAFIFNRSTGVVRVGRDVMDPEPFAAWCWATTVQSMNVGWPAPTPVLGSHAGMRVLVRDVDYPDTPYAPFDSGFVSSTLSQIVYGRTMVPISAVSIDRLSGSGTPVDGKLEGLPVIGVSFVRYVNGNMSMWGENNLSNYGAGSPLRTSRSTPPK